MSLSEGLKAHWIYAIVIVAAVSAGTTYRVVQALVVEPLRDEIRRQEKRIAELEGSGSKSKEASSERSRVALPLLDTSRGGVSSAPQGEAKGVKVDSASSSSPIEHTQVVENFLFELHGCSVSGNLARCAFTIKNQREDGKIMLYANNVYKSILYDNRGRAYEATEGQIGESRGTSAWKYMISGIPIEGSLTFVGLENGVTSVALLQVFCDVRSWRGPVEFRNIPFKKAS